MSTYTVAKHCVWVGEFLWATNEELVLCWRRIYVSHDRTHVLLFNLLRHTYVGLGYAEQLVVQYRTETYSKHDGSLGSTISTCAVNRSDTLHEMVW